MPFRHLAIVLVLAMLAACTAAKPPPTLFVLNPVATPPSDRSATGLPEILVAQVQVPDYLDRPQIVERTAANQLRLVEADQWAERLSVNVARVVAQNLSAMVPADVNVVQAARASLPFDYEVVLALNSFEIDQGGAALLTGRWSVTNADGTRELAAASVSLHQPPSRPGIAAAVEAMNANLGAVCRDIAAAIKRLPPAK